MFQHNIQYPKEPISILIHEVHTHVSTDVHVSILSTYFKYSDISKFFISAMKFKITKFDCLNI